MQWNLFLPFRSPAKRGPVRRALAAMGESWLCSPLRRLVQAACLVGFLWLFLYVCWPYTARPAQVWSGWLPVEVDAQSGRIVLENEQPADELPGPSTPLYVVDESASQRPCLGRFRIVGMSERKLTLRPVEPLRVEAADQLASSFGPWSLCEQEPGGLPSHYADDLRTKELLPAETLLVLDPLVSVSTALAGKCWVWSLSFAGVVLAVCLVIPRGFCGYVCPMGTLIDLFDWAVGRRLTRFRVQENGWWVHIKYYLLLAVLIASLCGVLIAGFVAAIPLITRGMAFLVTPLQTAAARGWHQVPAIGAGQWVSTGLFLAVLLLGLLRPRFWCKYVCPSGAVFSVANVLRLSERKVRADCIACGQCVEVCPFDAIKPDFTTRGSDCTFCQTCGGACPVGAIAFVPRWRREALRPAGDPPTAGTPLGRRGFLATTIGGVAGAVGGAAAAVTIRMLGPRPDETIPSLPVRPPGSVPEREFLELCIRCGECFQACPNDVLQPMGLKRGPDALWTPQVVADWSACEPSCNNCGQVCPTGAVRALPLEEKRAARMALAVVNEQTCLPYAGREACQLCVDECVTAGYEAIEFVRVGTEVDELGVPVEGSGFLAPVVLAEKCVGCGLCQTRCRAVNCVQKGLLGESAVVIEAGPGKEDRLMSGSYVALRKAEEKQREAARRRQLEETGGGEEGYLPDFLK